LQEFAVIVDNIYMS